MTTVETAMLTADEARALTGQIQEAADQLWELIKQAYRGRVWLAMEYRTWEEYCNTELRCPRILMSERPAIIATLRSAGMSTRAIAAATGTSKGTVNRAETVNRADAGKAAAVVQGIDGKTYPARVAPVRRKTVAPDPITAPVDNVETRIAKVRPAVEEFAEHNSPESADWAADWAALLAMVRDVMVQSSRL